MSSVVELNSHKQSLKKPTLVLVGLHEQCDDVAEADLKERVLPNCRIALQRARQKGVPVAHVRTITITPEQKRKYPSWIAGFEPERMDMIFDISRPSCYSSGEFSRLMDYSNGNFALAGLFAETTCLSTAVDAFHRQHRFVLLSDAAACRDGRHSIPTPLFHDATIQTISIYGEIMKTSVWGESLRQGGGYGP